MAPLVVQAAEQARAAQAWEGVESALSLHVHCIPAGHSCGCCLSDQAILTPADAEEVLVVFLSEQSSILAYQGLREGMP